MNDRREHADYWCSSRHWSGVCNLKMARGYLCYQAKVKIRLSRSLEKSLLEELGHNYDRERPDYEAN